MSRRFAPPRWLRAWLDEEVKQRVDAELKRRRIDYEDPLPALRESAAELNRQLAAAANVVGRDVMVGRDVIIWGGKFAGGLGVELHDGARLYDACRLVVDQVSPASGIVIAAKAALNFGVYVDGSGGVRIGERSILGPNVVIVSSSHRTDPAIATQDAGKSFGAVTIGADVWIGANAVILMGVSIGDHATVGAGSIVTRDVPAHTVVVGNPARIRE